MCVYVWIWGGVWHFWGSVLVLTHYLSGGSICFRWTGAV